MKKISIFIILLIALRIPVFAQNDEASRRATIQFGTETEIATLIQALRAENADYLDSELVKLIDTTKNQKILSGVFGFFGDREKQGLEERAIRAVVERDDETNETVLSAVDYLGKIKSGKAVPVIIGLLDTEERRFLTIGFRALGRAGSAGKEEAEQATEFLLDYYENRDPGNENQREIIIALGATGSPKAVDFLIDIASSTDERIPLRISALESLSKIADPAGLDAILGCVSTNDPNVRSAAVGALGPFSGEAVDKAILDAFRDSYYRTRIAACQASRDRKLASAVPYLQYRAERDDVPNVKEEAIRALGAIANDEAIEVLNALFTERKNADRVRITCAQMIMKNRADANVNRLIIEMEEAKTKNQTSLYNGLLKVLGESTVTSLSKEYETVTGRFMANGTIIEKLYALDMAANNNIRSTDAQIIAMTKDKNESIARRARRTAEKLGIEIPEE